MLKLSAIYLIVLRTDGKESICGFLVISSNVLNHNIDGMPQRVIMQQQNDGFLLQFLIEDTPYLADNTHFLHKREREREREIREKKRDRYQRSYII